MWMDQNGVSRELGLLNNHLRLVVVQNVFFFFVCSKQKQDGILEPFVKSHNYVHKKIWINSNVFISIDIKIHVDI